MGQAQSKQFGRYSLVRRLGVGGMAETFVATRRMGDIDQLVCLKRVLPAYNQDREFLRLFVREAKLAGRLRHQNIVGVLDFGSEDDEHFLVLELVDGVDLRALLSAQPEKRLPPTIAALIALDLAHALDYAHTIAADGVQGIVHRDLTPSNVLLSARGDVKLADFGVAKAINGSTAATASGVVKGKVAYMAPEQMRAQAVDGRADLFSLGVTLFEALAGRRPFVGAHDVETMMNLLEGKRPTLRESAPHVSDALCEVVEQLLQLDPAQRLDSAATLIERLAICVESESGRATLGELVTAAYGSDREVLRTRDTSFAPVPSASKDTAIQGSDTLDEAEPRSAIVERIEPASSSAKESRESGEPGEPSAPEPSAPEPSTPEPSAHDTAPGGMVAAAPVDSAAGAEPDTSPDNEPDTIPEPAVAELTTEETIREVFSPTPKRKLWAVGALGLSAVAALGLVLSLSTSDSAATPEQAAATRDHAEAVPPTVTAESVPSPTHKLVKTTPTTTTMEQLPEGLDVPDEVAASTEVGAQAQPGNLAATDTTEEANPPAAPEPALDSPAEESGTPHSTESIDARVATLRIVAIPFGRISVDGRRRGRAPVTVRLTPGRHRIRADNGESSAERVIRVRAGERREVEVEIAD